MGSCSPDRIEILKKMLLQPTSHVTTPPCFCWNSGGKKKRERFVNLGWPIIRVIITTWAVFKTLGWHSMKYWLVNMVDGFIFLHQLVGYPSHPIIYRVLYNSRDPYFMADETIPFTSKHLKRCQLDPPKPTYQTPFTSAQYDWII